MDELLKRAHDALEESYAPYSEYPVGAALRVADGTVYTGCNIENANYSNSLHAEEVAIGKAVSNGHQHFEKLAVVSAAEDGLTPCGMCRQTLAEFCEEGFEIVTDAGESTPVHTLGELLPDTISADQLADAAKNRGEQQ